MLYESRKYTIFRKKSENTGIKGTINKINISYMCVLYSPKLYGPLNINDSLFFVKQSSVIYHRFLKQNLMINHYHIWLSYSFKFLFRSFNMSPLNMDAWDGYFHLIFFLTKQILIPVNGLECLPFVTSTCSKIKH